MTAIDDPAAPVARHPRREAQEVAGDAFEARVLEPSPPAVVDADDQRAAALAFLRRGRALLEP